MLEFILPDILKFFLDQSLLRRHSKVFTNQNPVEYYFTVVKSQFFRFKNKVRTTKAKVTTNLATCCPSINR